MVLAHMFPLREKEKQQSFLKLLRTLAKEGQHGNRLGLPFQPTRRIVGNGIRRHCKTKQKFLSQ